MIGTEALGKWLTYRASLNMRQTLMPFDMRRFDTESDDATRIGIHHDHHPESLQQDRLAAKQIDAP